MRVIPPITGASPSITPTMLINTSVIETAPAVHVMGTTYVVDALVSDRSDNLYEIYRSLQNGNTGHPPASSPTYWELIGYTYPVYNAGTPYALADRVIDTTTHRVYESLIPANAGFPLTDETRWEDVGATSRWAPFDILRNTGAVGASPMTYVIAPGRRVDAIGVSGVVADRVTFTLRVAGEVIFEETVPLSYRNTLTWSDYFFGDFNFRNSASAFNLPQYANVEITVTLERENGLCTLGSLFVGKSVFLGDVEPSGSITSRNFSTIDRKFDGEVILIQRRTIPQSSQRLLTEKVHIPNIKAIQETLNAVPAFWAGLDDQTNEYYEPFVIVGIYTRLDIVPEEPWARILLDLEET